MAREIKNIPEARASTSYIDQFEMRALAPKQGPNLVSILATGADSEVDQSILIDSNTEGHPNMPLGEKLELLCLHKGEI